MQAVLLAAGMGTRLRPLTDTVPKCLVPINGRPLLDIWLHQLNDAGFSHFVINTHYLADRVEAYIAESPFRHRIRLVPEQELLGTLGTLRKLASFLSEDTLVAHADNLCLCSWSSFVKAHQQRPEGCDVTMMTFQTDSPQTCGIVETDAEGRVVMMHEKVANPPGNRANAAVYLMSSGLLSRLEQKAGAPEDISRHLIPHLHGRIYAWDCDGYMRDIGNPAAYQKAQDDFNGRDPLLMRKD